MKHCEPNLGPRLFKETTTVSLFLNNKKKVFLFFGTLSLTLLIFIQRYVFAYYTMDFVHNCSDLLLR